MKAAQADAVQAVIFDFDGLLMDTESTSFLSWQYEWGQWGLTLAAADFFVNHGGDVSEDRYASLAAAVGPRFDRKLSQQRRVAYRKILNEQLDLADGLRDWLDEAASLGIRLAVASSSPVEWVTTHLCQAGVLDTFEVLAGGDEVGRHKPAPDVYELALGRLSLTAASAVAVEDTGHGVAAAQAAGMRCIAIPNRFVPRERVRDADLVIPSASQFRLEEALRQLSCAS